MQPWITSPPAGLDAKSEAGRHALLDWASSRPTGVSENEILARLVIAGLELDEAAEMIKIVRPHREKLGRERFTSPASRARLRPSSPFWMLSIGSICLTLGVGTWYATVVAARGHGGIYVVPYGLILYGLWALCLGYSQLRATPARRRAARGQCPCCGYDRKGLPRGSQCPECGGLAQAA